MKETVLNLGGIWQVAAFKDRSDSPTQCPETTDLDWIEAAVPGSILSDLVAAEQLVNPLENRDAAEAAAWVADSDWLYRRSFAVPAELLAYRHAFLQLRLVDTFAEVWVNGILVGETLNMHRIYRFDLTDAGLRPEGNELLVRMKGHYRMVSSKVEDAKRLAVGQDTLLYRTKSLIRRYQRGFNTSVLNMGSAVIAIGLEGAVELCFYPEPFIQGYHIATEKVVGGEATVRVDVSLARAGRDGESIEVAAVLSEQGFEHGVAEISTTDTAATLYIRVSNAKLWWPRGYGEPHLYDLELKLSYAGEVIQSVTSRVGLRQVELVQNLPNGKKTFYFVLNGRKIYARGGDLAPIDAINAEVPGEAYDRLLDLVVHSNMNMVRIWGGGLPENPYFLDRCDELGIMIWQEYFYHSHPYPDYDPEFLAEAEREAIDVTCYMRNRACLALISGGNEQIEIWDKHWKPDLDRFYGEKLIYEVGPKVAQDYAPEIPYIPNSPFGGKWAQSPVEGDTHTWGDYYNATKDPQFVTETCWIKDSYSRPETLKEFMDLDTDVPEFSQRGWHRLWRERTGLSLISNTLYSEYHDYGSLREYLRVLEIEQHQADYHALSMLRMRSNSCNGIIYWPLNKLGPLFGFGAIDYAQRPLMAYYVIRHLFADVVVHAYRDVEDVRVVASNLGSEPIEADLRLSHLNATGAVLRAWSMPVSVVPGNSTRLFDIESFMASVVDRTDELLQVELVAEGEMLSTDTLYFCPLSEYQVLPGELSAEAERVNASTWDLMLNTSRVLKLIEIEADERILCSENYFTLTPGSTRHVQLKTVGSTATPIKVTVSALDSLMKRELLLC